MISVLVAAKDEEAVIEKCLRSMLDQDYPNYEVILINDRSRDQTGPIAERLAGENSKLRVLHVREGELAEGWFGKNNAMRLGEQAARGQWFCFIDADCTQTSRSTLSQAYQYARKHESEFLSVLPRLEAHGFWEQVLQPVCGGILVFWFRPGRVNNPAKPTAYANGAFMLMSKDAYWRIGGHEPVKGEVNEDIHMAALAKRAGVRIRVVQNEGLYITRMYDGFRATWRGWSRIFYGSFVERRRLIISQAVMLADGAAAVFSMRWRADRPGLWRDRDAGAGSGGDRRRLHHRPAIGAGAVLPADRHRALVHADLRPGRGNLDRHFCQRHAQGRRAIRGRVARHDICRQAACGGLVVSGRWPVTSDEQTREREDLETGGTFRIA